MTSPKAVGSISLGIVSVLFGFLTGLPAVVQGLRGLHDIRHGAGRICGRGLALAGIGTGLLGTFWGVAVLVYAVGDLRESAEKLH
jgi:hypothetical protein